MTPEQREKKNARVRWRLANDPDFRDRRKASRRKYYVKNSDAMLAKARLWRQSRSDEQRAESLVKRNEWRRENPEDTSWKRYGITRTRRDRMAIDQGCACACCGDVARLVVDHDHKTGKVRALLCNYCNSAIGFLRDDPERAISAAEYLAKHQRPILALVA